MDEDKKKRDIGDLKPTIKPSHKEDPIMILATKINSVNVMNYDQFVYSTQFDIEELEMYAQAMQRLYVAQWTKAIEKELDQLPKNET